MTTNIAIISHEQHQLYSTLKSCSFAIRQTIVTFFEFGQDQFEASEYELIFDFTVQSTQEKISFLNKLSTQTISDLSFNNGEQVKENCSQLVGAMATGVFSPKNCYEVWINDNSYEQVIESIFCELKIDLFEAQELGFGFIFPRTIVQIINEAYYALAEDLASAQDIDAAMKAGVNYPLGPIEWAKKSGLKNINQLLNELYQSTGQERYLPCSHLLK